MFVVHGDASSDFAKCFSVKVKCTYYVDYMDLCPSKKNLEANLKIHLVSTKHVNDVDSRQTPLLRITGRSLSAF